MKYVLVSLILIMSFPASSEEIFKDSFEESEGNSSFIPQNAVYNILISGEGSFSGVPSGRPFTNLVATLYIFPTIEIVPITNNGINPRDVAIITNVSPILGTAGALWFGTNTSTCSLVNCQSAQSMIDVAIVETDENKNEIIVNLDSNFIATRARLSTFNIYNLTSNILAQVHNILAGGMAMQFRDNANTVIGVIRLLGSSGFAGPFPTSEYNATFVGTRIN